MGNVTSKGKHILAAHVGHFCHQSAEQRPVRRRSPGVLFFTTTLFFQTSSPPLPVKDDSPLSYLLNVGTHTKRAKSGRFGDP